MPILGALVLGVALVACGPAGATPTPVLTPFPTPVQVAPSYQPAPADSDEQTEPVKAPKSVHHSGKIVPIEIRIPAIGVDGKDWMPLGLDSHRELVVPPLTKPLTAGWYTGAPIPGDPGTSVVAGHVDGNHMAGVFLRLSEVKVGELIYVTRSDGKTATFKAVKTLKVPKDHFPTSVVYSNQQQAQLHLLSCGGRYDAKNRNYLDQIIVLANLVSLH